MEELRQGEELKRRGGNYIETYRESIYKHRLIHRGRIVTEGKTIAELNHDEKEIYIYTKKYADILEEVKANYSNYRIPEIISAIGSPI